MERGSFTWISHHFSIFHFLNTGTVPGAVFISFSSSGVAWVTENLTSVLKEHKIRYQLGGPIDQNMADKVYDSSLQVFLVVLSDNYPKMNVCLKGGKTSVPRRVGRGDLPLIIVSIDKIRTGRLFDLACLGKQNLLKFEGHKKNDWEKKLLQAIVGAKVVRFWKSTSQTDFQASNFHFWVKHLLIWTPAYFNSSRGKLSVCLSECVCR